MEIEAGELAVAALAAAVFAIVAISRKIGQARARARVRRRMRDGDKALVDHAVVTLTGTVEAVAGVIAAPLSGAPCVVHRSLVRVTHETPREPHVQPGDYVLAEEMVDFILDVGERKVVVTCRAPDMLVPERPVFPVQLGRAMELLASNLVEVNVHKADFFEIVIAPGERVTVNGVLLVEAAREGSGEHGYRDAPTTMRIVGDVAHPLTIASA